MIPASDCVSPARSVLMLRLEEVREVLEPREGQPFLAGGEDLPG